MDESETQLVALAAVLVLGIAGQWIAWRIKLPSILLLLTLGVLAGPVIGLVRPDEMLGSLLFPLVSLCVAIILFEGSLSLRLKELGEIGGVLFKLLTLGALVTWVLTTAAAYFVLQFPLFKAVLLGAILVVTGPTVIGPLLRHIRPLGRVGPIARWEGIVIDPIGAVLAVLVLEAHLAISEAGVSWASRQAAVGLLKTIAIGGGLGVAGALLVGQILKRHLVPDHLLSAATLMVVLTAFVGSNLVAHESGLLAVTVMGVVLANLRGVILHPILEFKENLSVLLISSLFILLAARLDLGAVSELGWRGPAFVALLILVVRPLSVVVSSFRSRLTWQERTFLAWMAPRGIVAASVASVFALRLGVRPPNEQIPDSPREVVEAVASPDEDLKPRVSILNTPGGGLVSATFLVISGTVIVYGLTAFPLARRLGLAVANPQGILIGGADAVARTIGLALQEAGFRVLLVDVNPFNVQSARMAGLPTTRVNILSEHAVEDLDLGGIGRFFGMIPNDEVNSLAAMHLAPLFGRAEVYQLTPPDKGAGKSEAAGHLRARFLFGSDVTHRALRDMIDRGATAKTTKLTEEFDYQAFQERYPESALVMFLIEQGRLIVATEQSKLNPKPGQTIIALIPGGGKDSGSSV